MSIDKMFMERHMTGFTATKNVNVNAPDGKIDIKKFKPIAVDSSANTYMVLGEVVGKAFADGLVLK